MAGRNSNHDGTFRKSQNGKGWVCSIQCTYPQLNGKRKVVVATGKTKTEAKNKAKQKQKEWDRLRSNDITIDEDKKEETLEKTMDEWLKKHAQSRNWTSSTLETYSNLIKSAIYKDYGDTVVKNINTKLVNEIIENMIKNHARKSNGMVYSMFQQYCYDMTISHVFAEDPFSNAIKLPPRDAPVELTKEEFEEQEDDVVNLFTEDEILSIKNYILTELIFFDETPYKRKRYRYMKYKALMFYVMFLTGMRGQEIRALTLSDFNFDKHTIKIDKALSIKYGEEKSQMISKSPKTRNSRRVIGIDRETEEMIKQCIQYRPNQECEFFCCTSTGNWINKDNFRKMFYQLLKELNIERNGRTPHGLRHTFISFAIEGNDLSPLKHKENLFISQYVGHASLSITLDVYTHLNGKKLEVITDDDDKDDNMIELTFE